MRVRRGVAVATAAVLLAGCAGDEPAAPDRTAAPSAPASPSPVPTTTTPGPAPSMVAAPCRGQDVEVLPGRAQVAAITVDLGSGATGLPRILQVLQERQAPATFFVTGAWVRANSDGLRRIAAAGHSIGNHTDDHADLVGLTEARIHVQLAATEREVERVTGRSTRPLFRFPFGSRDARSIASVNRSGYCAYRWTVDTLGWKGTSDGRTARTVVERVAAALRPGAIVLMHGGANPDDGSTLDADALPAVLDLLRERGYALTRLPATAP